MVTDSTVEQVKAFGRMLGLSSFALNERGIAGVEFENGVKMRLESCDGTLWVQALFAMPKTPEAVQRLLQEASEGRNPSGGAVVRAGYLERSGEALLALPIAASEVEVTRIDAAFRELFERAVRLRRAL